MLQNNKELTELKFYEGIEPVNGQKKNFTPQDDNGEYKIYVTIKSGYNVNRDYQCS